MKLPNTFLLFLSIAAFLLFFSTYLFYSKDLTTNTTGAPPYGQAEAEIPDNLDAAPFLKGWARPEGPPRVALQVGHWKNNEVPDELRNLRGNTGAQGGGKTEWEVNYQIAILTKEILIQKGVLVDILPATVPEKYFADAFVAIHADANTNETKTGYKAASSWRDYTGKSESLVETIENEYEKSTKLTKDNNITRNMKGYYAFSWWKYDHAVHPMTPSAILETGYLTNPMDRKIIVSKPQLSASGLAEGILKFLVDQGQM